MRWLFFFKDLDSVQRQNKAAANATCANKALLLKRNALAELCVGTLLSLQQINLPDSFHLYSDGGIMEAFFLLSCFPAKEMSQSKSRS